MKPARLTHRFPFFRHPKGDLWETGKPLLYCVGHPKSLDKITVAKGFYTDFASIPRPVRIVFPISQIAALPPVIHDWIYSTHERTRKEADEIFYEAMIAAGYDKPRAYAQYKAVRIGGSEGYNNTSPNNFRKRTPLLFEQYYKG